MLAATVVLDGRIVGTWRRTVRARRVDIGISLFEPLTGCERAIDAAAERYGRFLNLPPTVSIEDAERQHG